MRATHALAAGLAVTLLAACPVRAQEAPPPKPDPFSPIRFMLGAWKGENTGQPGSGASERAYAAELGGAVIAARNTAVYPPQPKNPKGETHRDSGFFSYDRARKLIVFRQFHSEGFVNQYVQDPAAGGPDQIVFVTEAIENIPPGWRARETYRRTGLDTMMETFELAAPGKPFEVYSECRLTRAK